MSNPDEEHATDRSLEIVYLLASVELFGGVKIALQQSNLLHEAGHRVTVASPSAPPDWFELEAQALQLPELSPEHLPPADLYIGTFYTTLAPALSAARRHGGRAVHLCQGFEGALSHNTADHPVIDQAYSLPLPALTVSDHLARLIEQRYRRPARRVPQPLDPFFRPDTPRRRSNSPARVLVTGVWEFYLKGVPLAIDAIDRVRERGVACDIVRVAQWPLGEEERARHQPAEYHHHIPPSRMAEVVRSCDLLLAPSWPVEGFGLPVLEAFASGVPVVASDIPSYREFASRSATLVPYDDPVGFARAAEELLSDPQRWSEQRRRGLELSERFTEARVAAELDAALRWARSVELGD